MLHKFGFFSVVIRTLSVKYTKKMKKVKSRGN